MMLSSRRSRPYPAVFMSALLAASTAFCTQPLPWPAQRDGICFAFATAQDPIVALDAQGSALSEVELTPHGLARLDAHGRLLVHGGYFTAEFVGEGILAAYRQAPCFVLELLLTPYDTTADQTGIVAAFGPKGESPNFALVQRGAALRFLLGLAAGESGGIDLCTVTAGVRTHLIVAHQGKSLVCWKDGVDVSTQLLDRAYDTWGPGEFTLGGAPDAPDWRGAIECVSLRTRPISAKAVAAEVDACAAVLSGRLPVPQLWVKARRIARSDYPSLERLAPYTQALTVDAYTVETVLRGEYPRDTLYVAHWAILDRTVLPFQKAPVGEEVELYLEAFDANPQLESEYLSDTVIEDFEIPLYYDAGGLSLGLALKGEAPGETGRPEAKFASMAVAGPTPAESAARAERIRRAKAALDAQVDASGGWEAWAEQLAQFQEALRAKLTELPAPNATVEGIDGFLFAADYVRAALPDGYIAHQDDQDRDPLSMITAFSAQLQRRGIDLVVVPLPTKVDLYPNKLAPESPLSVPVGLERARRIHRLLDAGVEVLDLLPVFQAAQANDADLLYHKDDGHWTARGTALAAEQLAGILAQYGFVAEFSGRGPGFEIHPTTITWRGHLVPGLPEARQAGFPPHEVVLNRVTDVNGLPYQDDDAAPVLVCGDSYAYWNRKQSAGISAQLAQRIAMPVAQLGQSGATGSIARAIAMKGEAYLASKRVILWIFTSKAWIMPGWSQIHID